MKNNAHNYLRAVDLHRKARRRPSRYRPQSCQVDADQSGGDSQAASTSTRGGDHAAEGEEQNRLVGGKIPIGLDFLFGKSVGQVVSRAGLDPGAAAPGRRSPGLRVVGTPARGVPVPAETEHDQHRHNPY